MHPDRPQSGEVPCGGQRAHSGKGDMGATVANWLLVTRSVLTARGFAAMHDRKFLFEIAARSVD